MSYEKDSSKRIKCPCGEGSIIFESASNEWGQVKEYGPYINCNKCKEKYIIKSEHFTPKPYHDYTNYYCVDKNTGDKIKIEL